MRSLIFAEGIKVTRVVSEGAGLVNYTKVTLGCIRADNEGNLFLCTSYFYMFLLYTVANNVMTIVTEINYYPNSLSSLVAEIFYY